MIDDKELAALFQAESEEHLQSLDEGLLRLEVNPQESTTLEQVFRNAHSLKGAARMLGVEGVEVLAHHFESALGGAARGQKALTPEIIDRLYRGLDAIRKLVKEAVTGANAGVDIEQVLAQLDGEEAAPTPTTEPAPEAEDSVPLGNQPPMAEAEPKAITFTTTPQTEVELASNQVSSLNEPAAPAHAAAPAQTAMVPADDAPTVAIEVADAQSSALTEVQDETSPITAPETTEISPRAANFKIETIRVEPTKLDALMTLAGELTVTTTRVTRGLAEFEAVAALWEEWQKDTTAMRSTFHELARRLQAETPNNVQRSGVANNTALKKLAAFQEREAARLEQLQALLRRLRQTTYEDVTRLNFVADEVEESIRKVRLLPLTNVFNLFPRMVRDLSRTQEKEVQLLVEGGETTADKRILEELKDPMMHMIRNAIDHGIELPQERERAGKPRLATLRLRGYQTATNVIVELSDDGRGLDVAAIKRSALKRRLHNEAELAAMSDEQVQLLIFSPGFSTSPLVTDVSGRGVGLDVVRANVEALRGSIQVDSAPGAGCRFRIQLPLTLATTRVLLVQVEGRTYALPVEWVQGAYYIAQQDIFSLEGRETTRLQG
ncbi:MAG: chemotaxis protein CheA, partial [Abitibacteriaceae bacterium]|nr:chemotaxis protein CheA [Abditibacteriaceae bacterium]